MDAITLVATTLGIATVIGGFLYWHFKTVNGFKDDIHKLEIKMMALQNKDDLQQQTIDQLSDLYPLLREAFAKTGSRK